MDQTLVCLNVGGVVGMAHSCQNLGTYSYLQLNVDGVFWSNQRFQSFFFQLKSNYFCDCDHLGKKTNLLAEWTLQNNMECCLSSRIDQTRALVKETIPFIIYLREVFSNLVNWLWCFFSKVLYYADEVVVCEINCWVQLCLWFFKQIRSPSCWSLTESVWWRLFNFTSHVENHPKSLWWVKDIIAKGFHWLMYGSLELPFFAHIHFSWFFSW